MYTKQPKKMLIINILDILRKYSDEDHRLSQKDIVDILRSEGINLARRPAAKYRQALKLPPSYQRRHP